ncbi:hypothetical protein FD33_GL000520 [Companilactobacillus paralimentarius DSM 13238 = JCM 10415]|jgi:hypothetical protein|uniref:Uncharacterized protein n=1 Tax=Companilactobacillus paralimentarius DSM 13238 = JCM 10415 TaxID=1122151 RepID=A0A0R1PC17_9LACO|nr:hypothetical protein [Companilactobacillus paralimentarius]KRL29788.1 hypothetical protein FD33_GL000520 [Companilactobacillus paralimentarius DSM 13238 = JCM 10415]MDR4934126.1 hypothetical protein [Companilactobacillus paralimentarius]
MVLGSLNWLFSFSLVVTIIFGIVIVVLSICWWQIFKLTIRRFNTEDKHHDR